MRARLQNHALDTAAYERRADYRAFCENEPSIPLFSRAFWLDAVCGPSAWDVALVRKGERLDACLPYYEPGTLLTRTIAMPPLTQTAGPWLRASTAGYAKRLAQEKDLLNELIDRLEAQCPFDRFQQSFHRSITNWLPFYWRGYSQTTRYTYVLPDLSQLETIWAGTQANVRTDVRKAQSRHGLSIRVVDDVEELLRLTTLTFARQGKAPPYDPNVVRAIDQACKLRGCRRVFLAQDAQGATHAAVYLVWDDNTAYYLMSGGDPDLRNSGATSLLVWEAISFASTIVQSFDFEGSMLEPVERFVRAFGARQAPFFSVTKTNSVLLELRTSLFRAATLLKGKLARVQKG
jgi:hypothetical protein